MTPKIFVYFILLVAVFFVTLQTSDAAALKTSEPAVTPPAKKQVEKILKVTNLPEKKEKDEEEIKLVTKKADEKLETKITTASYNDNEKKPNTNTVPPQHVTTKTPEITYTSDNIHYDGPDNVLVILDNDDNFNTFTSKFDKTTNEHITNNYGTSNMFLPGIGKPHLPKKYDDYLSYSKPALQEPGYYFPDATENAAMESLMKPSNVYSLINKQLYFPSLNNNLIVRDNYGNTYQRINDVYNPSYPMSGHMGSSMNNVYYPHSTGTVGPDISVQYQAAAPAGVKAYPAIYAAQNGVYPTQKPYVNIINKDDKNKRVEYVGYPGNRIEVNKMTSNIAYEYGGNVNTANVQPTLSTYNKYNVKRMQNTYTNQPEATQQYFYGGYESLPEAGKQYDFLEPDYESVNSYNYNGYDYPSYYGGRNNRKSFKGKRRYGKKLLKKMKRVSKG